MLLILYYFSNQVWTALTHQCYNFSLDVTLVSYNMYLVLSLHSKFNILLKLREKM